MKGLDRTRVARLYPALAIERGVTTGRGVAECTVGRDGALTGCHPLPGDPDGLGFSESAVLVAQVMQMNLWTDEGGPVEGAVIRLPIRFNLATPAAAPAP